MLIDDMKDKVFYVTSSVKRSTVDHFENGEDPDSTQIFDWDAIGFYKSIEELAEKAGITPDLGAWGTAGDGLIICSQLENEYGVPVGPGKYMNDFREGKVVLFSCVYEFTIKFIEGIFTPSEIELNERFEEIEQYGTL